MCANCITDLLYLFFSNDFCFGFDFLIFNSLFLSITIFFAGSEIYQEMLAKALAKHFGAKLLIFDSHSLLGVR